MRDDQYARLQGLSEKLTDVVLSEADPAKWPGDGVELAKLTRDERGDRYWCKKNAAATLTMLMKVHSLTGMIERNIAPPDDTGDDDGDLEKEVRNAEREAKQLLKKIAARSRATRN